MEYIPKVKQRKRDAALRRETHHTNLRMFAATDKQQRPPNCNNAALFTAAADNVPTLKTCLWREQPLQK